MLQIPGPLCGDKKADEIINAYVNERLVGLMSDILCEFDANDLEQNEEFIEEIFYLFPENYEREKQAKKFLELYGLLKDKEVYAPEQVMEYVLAQLLGLYEEMGVNEHEPMPNRAYVMEKLAEDFKADGSKSPLNDATEYLEQLEDPAQYMELIFWDLDFTLLEEYKEEDLARSNPELAKNANFEDR